ncbi:MULTISPECIES: retron system putative HNH endonuclease [unclassified Marinobacter]|uniref:retron system putative HNH endonuclease n=1 Tax=unclassified Marinobacter TaxID=83889 RepID=UPI0018F1741D|nr:MULTISPECIES: retron system putative HNH endonuclease [unclassified Marinobacter]
MVELQHRAGGIPALQDFLTNNPNPGVADWGSQTFQPVKQLVKQALNQDQQGLCAYCERRLAETDGQIDHIKPKGGANGHPQLCFSYSNYAHSCINPKTCGQKKKEGLLPIEPGPGCNSQWTLSTDGTIEPIADLNRAEKHTVNQTRDMLGLNKDSALVDDRQKWLNSALAVLRESPNDINAFLQSAPFRHILATVI